MNLEKLNSLVELFFNQYKEQNKNNAFLSSLKEPKKEFNWQETFDSVINVSKEISKYVSKSDRCLLISENRPEWLITDLSIMLSGSITVPAYTTYAERDYEFIIDDCEPSLVIVSNTEQYNKIKNILKNKKFIKKLLSFEELKNVDQNSYNNCLGL